MSKKGENIYKIKDQRWEGRYKKGRKENGNIHYGYIYGKNYLSVKEQLNEKKAEHQIIIESNGESSISYQKFCMNWLKKR